MKALIRFLSFVGVLCGIAMEVHAQSVIVQGHVTDFKTGAPLYPATIVNEATNRATYADSAGYYRITAKAGDVLSFSYLGFYTQKYTVQERLEYINHPVKLISKRQKLETVDIKALTPYQQDSLDRIRTFGHYLDLPVAHLLDKSSSASSGFGLVFHPFTYFSKAERRKRKFHKRYKQFEENAFIDSRYRSQLVQHLTGLSEDSLRQFMLHHRPSYGFTRTAGNLLFQSWIIRQCRSWRDSLRSSNKPK